MIACRVGVVSESNWSCRLEESRVRGSQLAKINLTCMGVKGEQEMDMQKAPAGLVKY